MNRQEMIARIRELQASRQQASAPQAEAPSQGMSREQMIQRIREIQAQRQRAEKENEVGAGEKAHAAIEGFADSSSLGTLPYLQAAGEYATDKIADLVFGESPSSDQSFDERVKRAKGQSAKVRENAPGYALGGQLAGFVVPGMGASKLVGKGANALAGSSKVASAIAKSGKASKLYKAAKAAEKVGNLKRAQILTKAARADLLAQGAKLGAEGAILGAAYTPETGISDVGQRIKGAAVGLGTGVAMPFALRGASKALKAPAYLGKKTLSALGGVSDDVIERYLQNPERIRGAETFDDLYERVSGVVKRIGDDLDDAKIDYKAAKAHLDDTAQAIKASRIEGKDKALTQVKVAKEALEESFKAQKQGLAKKAASSRIEPLIEDALDVQGRAVSEGSKKSFAVLDDLPAEKIKLNGPLSKAKAHLDFISKRSSQSAKQGAKDLGRYIDDIQAKAANGEIDGPEMKRILQDLDSDISSWERKTGAFDDERNIALKKLRKGLDSYLKKLSPAYKKEMAKVADDTDLLSKVSRDFGKKDTRLSKLANLSSPNAKFRLDQLRTLAKKQGGDELVAQLDEMIEAQKTLKSSERLSSIKQSLPEAQALREAEKSAAIAKKMAKPKFVLEAIKRNAANFKAQSAKAKLDRAKELANKFRSFNEQNAQGRLKAVARGNIHARKVLKELSQLEGEDFVEAVKAAQDAAQFESAFTRGSKNVNFWAVMGALGQSVASGRGAAGGATGAVFGGPVGMAMGAAFGAMVDAFGPKMTQRILDVVVKIRGPVTVKALKNLDLPSGPKAKLIEMFKSSVLAGRAQSVAKSAAESLIAEQNNKKETKLSDLGR